MADFVQLDGEGKNVYKKSSNAKVTSTPPPSSNPSTTVVTLLAANPSRIGKPMLVYDGADVLLVSLGDTDPTAVKYSFKMGKDYALSYEFPLDYSGAVKGIFLTNAGAVNANATEFI